MTMNKAEDKNIGRMIKGTVVSDKMAKTIVVEITRLRKHPKYKKYHKVSHRYKVHDPEQKFHVGDRVLFKETRPISKDKRWVAVQKI